MKPKKCKICKESFTPKRELQPTCERMECMVEYSMKHLSRSKALKKREANIARREYKETDKQHWKKKAREWLHRWIREVRDAEKPCISCGYAGEGRQWHAGHFIADGSNARLRYHEWNINKQCSICNNHLSGNTAEYRKELINRIGIEAVEWLEHHEQREPYSYDIDELKEIAEKYKAMCKENNGQGCLFG